MSNSGHIHHHPRQIEDHVFLAEVFGLPCAFIPTAHPSLNGITVHPCGGTTTSKQMTSDPTDTDADANANANANANQTITA